MISNYMSNREELKQAKDIISDLKGQLRQVSTADS